MLQRWRYSLQEQHRTFGGENRICAANLSDFRHRLPHALNRRLRAPAESVAPESGGELPAVFLRLGHLHKYRFALRRRTYALAQDIHEGPIAVNAPALSTRHLLHYAKPLELTDGAVDGGHG